MTEKIIFADKLFFAIKYFGFNLFFLCENCNPPLKKVAPLFPSNPTLKVKVLPSPPFLKIWLEVQPPLPPAERGWEGGGTLYG